MTNISLKGNSLCKDRLDRIDTFISSASAYLLARW